MAFARLDSERGARTGTEQAARGVGRVLRGAPGGREGPPRPVLPRRPADPRRPRAVGPAARQPPARDGLLPRPLPRRRGARRVRTPAPLPRPAPRGRGGRVRRGARAGLVLRLAPRERRPPPRPAAHAGRA